MHSPSQVHEIHHSSLIVTSQNYFTGICMFETLSKVSICICEWKHRDTHAMNTTATAISRVAMKEEQLRCHPDPPLEHKSHESYLDSPWQRLASHWPRFTFLPEDGERGPLRHLTHSFLKQANLNSPGYGNFLSYYIFYTNPTITRSEFSPFSLHTEKSCAYWKMIHLCQSQLRIHTRFF